MEALDFAKHNNGTNQIQHRYNMAKRQESLPAVAGDSVQRPFAADGGSDAADKIADPVGHEEYDQKNDPQSAFHTAVLLCDAYLDVGNDENQKTQQHHDLDGVVQKELNTAPDAACHIKPQC